MKVGVIGLGVGLHHARTAAAHPHCEVSLLCDLDSTRLKEVGESFPGVTLVSDALDVVAAPDVDLVVVAGYDSTHTEQVVAAIENGKHVFVEKPMCLSRDEAVRIQVALDASSTLRLSSNLGLRSCPRFQGVRQAVQQGSMGTIYHMEGEYLWGRPHKLTHGWRKDMEFYSIIHGAAIHMVDLLLWISGDLPVTVSGLGNSLATRGSQLRHNDFATLLLEYANGMTAKVAAHGGCVHPHFHRLAVYGTEKSFMNELSGGIWIESADPEVLPKSDEEAYPARKMRGDIMKSFIDAIEDASISPLVSEKDVFDCMAVCFAAEEAVATGKTIDIEYDF